MHRIANGAQAARAPSWRHESHDNQFISILSWYFINHLHCILVVVVGLGLHRNGNFDSETSDFEVFFLKSPDCIMIYDCPSPAGHVQHEIMYRAVRLNKLVQWYMLQVVFCGKLQVENMSNHVPIMPQCFEHESEHEIMFWYTVTNSCSGSWHHLAVHVQTCSKHVSAWNTKSCWRIRQTSSPVFIY